MKTYLKFSEIDVEAVRDDMSLRLIETDFQNEDVVLDDTFGGNMHVVETLKDIADTPLTSSLNELDTSSFEICEKVAGDYVFVFIATNNGGGPCWYIPYTVLEEFLGDSFEAFMDDTPTAEEVCDGDN